MNRMIGFIAGRLKDFQISGGKTKAELEMLVGSFIDTDAKQISWSHWPHSGCREVEESFLRRHGNSPCLVSAILQAMVYFSRAFNDMIYKAPYAVSAGFVHKPRNHG